MMKITVIIVAYNAQNYIERCLKSVFNQNANYDVVVVNDASTDMTGKILQKYTDRIKLINLKTNCKNLAKTRKIGLENADGDYITFLDADEWYETDALYKISRQINKYNPDIVKFGYTRVNIDGTQRKSNTGTEKDEFAEKNDFNKSVYPYFINGIGLNSVCCAVFKRSVIQNLKFSADFCTAEDAAFSLEAYTNAKNVLFLNEHLYCYYQTGRGLTGSGISVFKKYYYNFKLSVKILKLLPKWNMNTLVWKIKTFLRLIKLTTNKITRK